MDVYRQVKEEGTKVESLLKSEQTNLRAGRIERIHPINVKSANPFGGGWRRFAHREAGRRNLNACIRLRERYSRNDPVMDRFPLIPFIKFDFLQRLRTNKDHEKSIKD